MSAARRIDGRGQARKAHSSPYARPQSSGWSLRKLLEPIRRRVFGQAVENDDQGSRGHQFPRSPSPEDIQIVDEGSYMVVSEHIDGQVSEPPPSRSTTTSPRRPVPVESASASVTLENIIEFLTDAAGTSLKREEAQWVSSLIQKCISGERLVSQSLLQSIGRPLSAIEVEGMISLLQKSLNHGKPEPFRFQSATPSRSFSPSAPSSSTTTPKKTLKRNPNGVYRWEGAGSARQTPRLNRYSSPAFGTPQQTPEKTKSEGDKKRRKVDEELATSSSSDLSTTPKLAFPVTPQTPRSNGAGTPKLTIQASPSKLRTPALVKPTTPSQPSPLRQAWSGTPSSSQEDLSLYDQSLSTPPKQSQAANLVSELIKEVTPAKKPDLRNPYQTASPISKVGPPRRSTRRTRTTGQPSAPADEKPSEEETKTETSDDHIKDIPAQAIIEATLPKGSKRSRPPANLEKSSSPEFSSLQPTAHSTFFTIAEEEGSDSESDKAKTQTKSTFGFPTSATSKQENGTKETVKDVEKDVEMENEVVTEKPASGSLFGNHSGPSTNNHPTFSLKSTTAPSRPSKLRYSYQPEGVSAPTSPTSDPENKDSEFSAPLPPTTSSFFNLPSAPSTSKPPSPPSSSKMDEDTPPKPVNVDPKSQVLGLDKSALPTFTFSISFKSDIVHSQLRDEVKSKPLSALPVFDFSRSSIAAEKKSFSAGATTIPAPSTSSSSTWTCSLCMLKNPDSAKDKCSICDAPRPDAKAAAPAVKAFDWSAAGMKAPTSSSGATWNCDMCMLSNPDSAKEKCTVCDAPRPGAPAKAIAAPAPPPATPVKAFDWSAAGMKPPTTAGGASWTCSQCMLTNPASATSKCTICDAPR